MPPLKCQKSVDVKFVNGLFQLTIYLASAARRLARSLYQIIGAISKGTPVKKAACKSGIKTMMTRQITCDQMPKSVTYGKNGVLYRRLASVPAAIMALRLRYWLQQMEIQAIAPVKPDTASK